MDENQQIVNGEVAIQFFTLSLRQGILVISSHEIIDTITVG